MSASTTFSNNLGGGGSVQLSQRSPLQLQPPPTLNADQLRDMIDILRQPLTNRFAMIPVTNQAFRRGHLKPIVKKIKLQNNDNDKNNDNKDNNSNQEVLEEFVMFTFPDGRRQEMTRKEAMQYLEQERRQLIAGIPSCNSSSHNDNNNNNSDDQERKQPLKSSLKKSTSTKQQQQQQSSTRQVEKNTISSSVETDGSQKQAASASVNTSAGDKGNVHAGRTILPFFEIRETLEESINNVKGELVNVTSQLEQLQKISQDEQTKRSSDTIIDSVHEGKDNDNMDYQGFDIPEQTTVIKLISDDKYDQLQARLDQLALLEERSEIDKVQSLQSARKLTSSGWSKGFLNKDTKNKSSRKQKLAEITKENTKSNEKAKENSDLTTNDSISNESKSNSNTTSLTKKVGFASNDQVTEIPRIGKKSVSDLKQQAAAIGLVHERPRKVKASVPTFGNYHDDDDNNNNIIQQPIIQQQPRELIDSSVLASTVQERPRKKKQSSAGSNTSSDRPLSRFAQERNDLR